MSEIFTDPGDTGFNKNPPSDDGATTERNLGKLSTVIALLITPLVKRLMCLDEQIHSAFYRLEQHKVTFRNLTTAAQAFNEDTRKALIINVGGGGTGRTGGGSVAGQGGGSGGVNIVLATNLNGANATVGAGTYTNSDEGFSAAALTAVNERAGLNTIVNGTSGGVTAFVMAFDGIDGFPAYGAVPGEGATSLFGRGGYGGGGRGGLISTAGSAPIMADARSLVWEIE